MTLLDLGHKITLITEAMSGYWKNELSSKGVTFYVLSRKCSRLRSLSKVLSYLTFRKNTFDIIHRCYDKDTVIWVEGAQTIVSLGISLKKYNYNLQIQELHERYPFQLKAISKVIHSAGHVYMPEYNRACIYQCWFHLKKRPTVLPNKPYFLPTDKYLTSIEDKYETALSVFRKKKVILYQGHIHPERDLASFVSAIDSMSDEFCLVLLGHDHGDLSRYRQLSDRIIHIDFIPSPDYFVFTRMCYMGVVCYDPTQLNTTYCAPNKIYEYGAFSKPMIGNDIPGLMTVQSYNAGILCNDSVDDIRKAILQISSSYNTYSRGARALFDSVDIREIVNKSLES